MIGSLPPGAVRALSKDLGTCEALFGVILQGSLHSPAGTIAYPQRITFAGGAFWVETLLGGEIAVLALKDVLDTWTICAREEVAS